MAKRLPFEIRPTAAILAAPYPDAEEQEVVPIPQSMSSGDARQGQPKTVKYLDDEQGIKILALIYRRNGSIEKTERKKKTGEEIQESGLVRQRSSYILRRDEIEEEKKEEVLSVEKNGLDLWDKMSDYLRIESKRMVRHISLKLLVENDISLEDLIVECGVAFTDLLAAGILQSVEDLCALQFKTTDLVINERLFRVQHLPDFFKLYYPEMRKMKSICFGANDIIDCNFTPDELDQLRFSFDHLIKDKGINAKQLRFISVDMHYSLADFIRLGLLAENLVAMGITPRIACEAFGWDSQEVANFTGLPQHITRKGKKMNK